MLVVEVTHVWCNPKIQVHGERDQNDDIASHRRVEDVETEAAIEVFCHNDGEQRTRGGHPPGC